MLVAGEEADFLPSPQGGATASKDASLGLQDPPVWALQAGLGRGGCPLGTATQAAALPPPWGGWAEGHLAGSHTPIPQSLRPYLFLLGEKWKSK